jgi:SAM-dependent methyltransferase
MIWRKPCLRESLAKKYLKGDGIEIGALYAPLKVPARARVKYVDRLPVQELRKQYPELKDNALVDVDIIDDGESLKNIPSASLDFVIANHFLEHCTNPIGAIETFLRVLKQEGILYMAVPDKRFTFDRGRSVTTLEHLLKDYRQGSEWGRPEHFKEWAELVDREFKDDRTRDISILKSDYYSIHYHVWTSFDLLELLVFLRRQLNFDFELLEFFLAEGECIFIIKKAA